MNIHSILHIIYTEALISARNHITRALALEDHWHHTTLSDTFVDESELAVERFLLQSYGKSNQRNISKTIGFFNFDYGRKTFIFGCVNDARDAPALPGPNRLSNPSQPCRKYAEGQFLGQFKRNKHRTLTLCGFWFVNCCVEFGMKNLHLFWNCSVSCKTSSYILRLKKHLLLPKFDYSTWKNVTRPIRIAINFIVKIIFESIEFSVQVKRSIFPRFFFWSGRGWLRMADSSYFSTSCDSLPWNNRLLFNGS